MIIHFYSNKRFLLFIGLIILFTPVAWADIQPRSASLNYSQKSLSNAGNPAAAALVIELDDPQVMKGGAIEIGGGLEYGDLDDLFDKIDELSSDFKSPSDTSGTSGTSGIDIPTSIEGSNTDYTWDNLLLEYPDLEDRVGAIKNKAVASAALLAIIAAEGYGKAEATSEASFILNDNLYKGTLLMGLSFKGNARATGLFENIEFDAEQAKSALESLPSFSENDPVQTLDLSGGITLFYNPQNKKTKFTIDNDSLLLIKATKIAQFSLSYSHKAFENDLGQLYWGVKPSFYRVGLTNVSARLGEITDSEALFDDIRNTNFIYKNGFDMDLGLVWSSLHYQVGMSVTNLIEQTFKYPEIDESAFQSTEILKKVDFNKEFTMQRQVRLEAGIFTEQRDWSLHAEIDANPVEDPMRDKYQWATLTAGYATDSWWLPSARVGLSRNLAGTKLSYLNAGITVMKFINLDIATTLDTVNLEGDKIRRGINVRLGIQFEY